MRTSQAFPLLDDEQMEEVARLGVRTEFKSGEILISAGQQDYPFFVMEQGEVEIVESDAGGETSLGHDRGKEVFEEIRDDFFAKPTHAFTPFEEVS